MTLEVELQADESVFYRDDVTVRALITNRGETPIDPGVADSQLIVDGKPAEEWRTVMAQSEHPARERSVAPDRPLGIRYRLRASRLFDEYGRHTIVLEIGGVRSKPVDVMLNQA